MRAEALATLQRGLGAKDGATLLFVFRSYSYIIIIIIIVIILIIMIIVYFLVFLLCFFLFKQFLKCISLFLFNS